jgi:pimeloyl-ACP methyl ester carboxylesterase
MATSVILPITGYHGRAVPNRLLRPRSPIDQLAVLLPGLGYTLDMPLFYYIQMMGLDAGIDVLRVETAYNRDPDFAAATDDEQVEWVTTDAKAAWHAALARTEYLAAVIVGKSLGTLAMSGLLDERTARNLTFHSVWLTPLLSETIVRQAIRWIGGRALVVIGDADPYYDPEILAQLNETGVQVVAILGADHGMNLPGDAVGSVRVLERVTAATLDFCSTSE